MTNTKSKIESKLQSLQPQFLEVINESNRHNVPAGSESHFKVTIVSTVFNDKSLLARHRLINSTLTNEIIRSIHALALHTFTLEEWQKRQHTAQSSPPCLGGAPNEVRAGAKIL